MLRLSRSFCFDILTSFRLPVKLRRQLISTVFTAVHIQKSYDRVLALPGATAGFLLSL